MGLLFRFGLIALFLSGAFALDMASPELTEHPAAVAALVVLGLILTASLFERPLGRPRGRSRAAARREARAARARLALLARPAGREGRVLETIASGGPTLSSMTEKLAAANRMRRTMTRLRAAALNMVVWFAVVGALFVGYANRSELKEGALLALSALKPGAPVAISADEAVLTVDRGGHFITTVTINAQDVRMLVDTGSSDVALPYEEAERLGVDMGTLSFTRAVMTANGQAMVAPVILPEVTVGPITLRDVPASVAEPGRLGSALLGMSFLGKLREVNIKGDQLRLRGG